MPSNSRRLNAQPLAVAALATVGFLLGTSCGTPTEKQRAPSTDSIAKVPTAATKPKAVDSVRFLARDGQVSAQFVDDELLGIVALPGGNLAEYKKGGKRFQQFLLKAPTVGLGAVYLTEVKSAMKNPKFVASFGGYFGELDGKPAFVFTKNEYVTGFVGLSREEADAEGRLAAARIP